MNFETLLHIYELLETEVNIKEDAKNKARELMNEAFENDFKNCKELESIYEAAFEEYSKVSRFLNDFKNSEWHC